MADSNGRVRLGLIGAGIFMRDAHLPALLNLQEEYAITAVWSRTVESATRLAGMVEGTTGVSPSVESELAALLARDDIDAVDIVLPIDSQPDVVRKALAAGKHVISEKPIASTVAAARALVNDWLGTGRTWMVAENWRYESAYVVARELIAKGTIGTPILASWQLHMPSTPDLPYYHTDWRRAGNFPGGYVLDAGVHHAAVFRQLLGNASNAQAFVVQHNPNIPPVDTLAATLQFENGALATYAASYAETPAIRTPLVIVGTQAILKVGRGIVEIERDGHTESQTIPSLDGVRNELAAFAAALNGGAPHINTPQEALKDLAIIEAILESGETGAVAQVANA